MAKYYIEINNEQKGPFSIDELKAIVLAKNSLVWREGLDDWTEAQKVDELASLFEVSPPPLPKKISSKNIDPIKIKVTDHIDVNLRKVKTEEQIIKQEKAAIRFSKEIVKNLKLLLASILIGAGIWVITYGVTWGINQGDIREYEERIESTEKSIDRNNNELDKILQQASLTQNDILYIDIGVGFRLEINNPVLYNEKRNNALFDAGLTMSEIDAINSIEKDIDRETDNNKSYREEIRYMQGEPEWRANEIAGISTIVLSLILTIGRYLLQMTKWVKRNAQKDL